MRSPHYILKDGKVTPARDVLEWACWFESSDRERLVERTEVVPGITVSTIFMGLDHSFSEGPPVLWETMVFQENAGPPQIVGLFGAKVLQWPHSTWDLQRRYASELAARTGHWEIVERVRSVVLL